MKRTEEIQKLIDEEMGIDNYGSCDFQVGVIYGVKHADKTMIEKAYQWILNNMHKYIKASGFEIFINNEDMANDFKQAMEE